MNQYIKVSIIIPVYNVEQYIEDCLKSVFSQSYSNLEVIIIDDCGYDNSMKIVLSEINKHKTFDIKIIHHSRNKGLSAARNSGIKKSRGDYLFFLDSDDTLPTNAIENLVNTAIKYFNPHFIIGEIVTYGFRTDKYPLFSQEYIDEDKIILMDYICNKWNTMACNKLIKRSFCLENNLFFLENKLHEDIDFSFRLAFYAKSMACCYNITYNYLTRNNSITTLKQKKNYIDYIEIIKKNFTVLSNMKFEKKDQILVSNYIINILFYIYVSILNENSKSITNSDKNELITHIKKLKELKTIKGLYFKNYFKALFIKLPYVINKLILKIIPI